MTEAKKTAPQIKLPIVPETVGLSQGFEFSFFSISPPPSPNCFDLRVRIAKQYKTGKRFLYGTFNKLSRGWGNNIVVGLLRTLFRLDTAKISALIAGQ